jgi:hypothetical protein
LLRLFAIARVTNFRKSFLIRDPRPHEQSELAKQRSNRRSKSVTKIEAELRGINL